MTRVKRSFLVLSLISLAGCQTELTAARFKSAQGDIQQCYQTVAAAQKAQQMPRFKDDRDLLVYLVVQKMTASNPYSHCDDAYIAMIQADSQKTSGISNIVKTGVGVGLGLVGVKILADGIVDVADDGGASEIGNVEGSRVVNRSSAAGGSTISSSGAGLGVGNVFSRNTAQGGIEPRQWQTGQGTTVTDINTESQSGTNAEVEPVEGGDSIVGE